MLCLINRFVLQAKLEANCRQFFRAFCVHSFVEPEQQKNICAARVSNETENRQSHLPISIREFVLVEAINVSREATSFHHRIEAKTDKTT